MSKDWTMVRLQRKTAASLKALAKAWQSAYEIGRYNSCPGKPHDGVISLDAVIEELIRREYDHQARRAKSAVKKAQERLGEADEGNGEQG